MIDIQDRIDELPENGGRLKLLQKTIFFGVFEEISFVHEFCDNVELILGLVLAVVLDDVWVVALSEDAAFPLDDFLLIGS